jgi:hypothetical protein
MPDGRSPPSAWPAQLAGYWIDEAEVLSAEQRQDEKPGRDSLGNPGRVQVVAQEGRLGVHWPRRRVVERLVETGLRPIRATAEETELDSPAKKEKSEEIDPFLLERSVVATVKGREFPGGTRAVVEAKVAALRREFADAKTAPQRREAAARMLQELEEGLRSTLQVRTVERRFHPAVTVKDPIEKMGAIVPLHAGSRIVYRVNPVKPEEGEEGDAEPMVFHLVGIGLREVVMLYTGGVHGQRHLRDLDESSVHHAWFANRERVKTEATAPWIGRRLFCELVENGCGEIVIHKRRDPQPISIEKIGEDTSFVRVDGRALEVPVIRCRTSKDDDLVVLRDVESPLLLRLVETGAELVRTIDAIHSAPGRPFVFPSGQQPAPTAKL